MKQHYLNMQDATFQATKHMEHKRLKALSQGQCFAYLSHAEDRLNS